MTVFLPEMGMFSYISEIRYTTGFQSRIKLTQDK